MVLLFIVSNGSNKLKKRGTIKKILLSFKLEEVKDALNQINFSKVWSVFAATG